MVDESDKQQLAVKTSRNACYSQNAENAASICRAIYVLLLQLAMNDQATLQSCSCVRCQAECCAAVAAGSVFRRFGAVHGPAASSSTHEALSWLWSRSNSSIERQWSGVSPQRHSRCVTRLCSRRSSTAGAVRPTSGTSGTAANKVANSNHGIA